MIVRLGRRYRFFAAHRLHSSRLSDTENARTYGKCNHPNGHGHTYEVTVLVEGAPDPQTGMVADLADVDAAAAEVIDGLAYRHLDLEIPFFREHVSTSERIAQYLFRELEPRLDRTGAVLARVEVGETRNNHFEIERRAS